MILCDKEPFDLDKFKLGWFAVDLYGDTYSYRYSRTNNELVILNRNCSSVEHREPDGSDRRYYSKQLLWVIPHRDFV
jgi:hypothetical protein